MTRLPVEVPPFQLAEHLEPARATVAATMKVAFWRIAADQNVVPARHVIDARRPHHDPAVQTFGSRSDLLRHHRADQRPGKVAVMLFVDSAGSVIVHVEASTGDASALVGRRHGDTFEWNCYAAGPRLAREMWQ